MILHISSSRIRYFYATVDSDDGQIQSWDGKLPYSNSWLPVLASELSGSLAACDRSPHFMKLSKGLVRPSFPICSALGRYDRQRLHTDRQNPIPCRCPAPAYLLSLYFYIVIRADYVPAHTLYRSSYRFFLRLVLSVFQLFIPGRYSLEKIVWSLSASLICPSAFFYQFHLFRLLL